MTKYLERVCLFNNDMLILEQKRDSLSFLIYLMNFIYYMKKEDFKNDYKVINNLRCLSLDMIDNAKSGHPGICLGAAPILYTLFSRHLNIYPKDPNWYNRDRFILSAGHGAPMLYATLYMLGYITLDALIDAIGMPKDNLCLGCLNECYPTDLPDDIEAESYYKP